MCSPWYWWSRVWVHCEFDPFTSRIIQDPTPGPLACWQPCDEWWWSYRSSQQHQQQALLPKWGGKWSLWSGSMDLPCRVNNEDMRLRPQLLGDPTCSLRQIFGSCTTLPGCAPLGDARCENQSTGNSMNTPMTNGIGHPQAGVACKDTLVHLRWVTEPWLSG